MASTGTRATETMVVRDHRPLALITCLLAAILIGLPWADGGRSPAGQSAVVLLLVVAAAAALLARDTRPLAQPSPWILLGAVLIVVSAAQTIHPDRTIQSILLLLAYLLAGTLAGRGARQEAWTERVLLGAGALSGTLLVGVGIVWLLGGNEGGFYSTVLIGPFGYPNALAGYLLLTAGAAVATWQPDRSRLERLLGLAAGLACAVGLILARSRGAWVAAVAGLLYRALVQHHRWWRHRRFWVPAATLALLIAGGVGGHWLAGFVQSLWSHGGQTVADTSIQWRLSILGWTWRMIQEHPWFGVGPGAFPVALLQYQELPYVSGENPHNLYVEIAAEYGIAAGVLVSVGVLVFLARATAATRQLSAADPVRGRRTALLAALVAFGVHSATDLDWSYPAVSLLCAVILGLVSSGLPERPAWRTRQPARWRAAVLIVLACASIVALTRYYGATFVAWGRDALSAGNVGEAAQYLRYARALNPTSFSAHAWLARTELRTGNPAGALETAQRTIRIAPADPNTHALAGEMALAAGRWRQAHLHFQSAVERGPASHLWFHGALLDAAAAMKDPTEAKRVYARAGSVFTDDRVLGGEARCLAPGDRYLLARMSRVFADLARRHGMSAEYKAAEARAGVLAQPDLRGICGRGGQPGQTSPEAVVASYWRAVSDAGWAAGERYLLPARRRGGNEASPPEAARSEGGRFRLAWVYSLSGGERRAAVVHQTAAENGSPDGDACARAVAMFTPEGWYLEDAPRRDRVPCRP